MLYHCDDYVFSPPVVSRSKAQREGDGYSLDEYWNVVARRCREALWVSTFMSRDGVARLAVNINKLTEHAIITRIKH